MASSSSFLLLLLFSFFFHIQTFSFIIPITKDLSTNQYLATVYHGTPLKPTSLVVDLGGPFLWMDCESGLHSSSRLPIPNRSIKCLTAAAGAVQDRRSVSRAGACKLLSGNPIMGSEGEGQLVEDSVSVRSLDGSAAAMIVSVYSCAPKFLLRGLAKSARGIVGLGRSQISLPAQISTEFGFHRRFSVCLSSSNGVVFPENGNHHDSVFGSEISGSLTYTPLLTSKIAGAQSPEYFINVKSIKVNGNRLSVNKTLLVLDDGGNGGTKLSTVVPYTTLESSIFAALTAAFKEAATAMNMREVDPVGPFEVCFSSEDMDMSPVGPRVPEIELTLQSEMVGWKIFGRNSMVKVSDETICLGFIDGGLKMKNSIVLGGYQMEDILMNFDVGTSMLGFSSSLLQRKRSCSEFMADEFSKETM